MANTRTAHKTSNSRHRTSAAAAAAELSDMDPAEIGRDMVQYLREYARENPESAALWCFGIGFVLGWKLKMW